MVLASLITYTAGICTAQEVDKPGPWGPQPVMYPASKQHSPSELPFRSWQLQTDNDGNARKLIATAKDYGINNIQLSHDLVMYGRRF